MGYCWGDVTNMNLGCCGGINWGKCVVVWFFVFVLCCFLLCFCLLIEGDRVRREWIFVLCGEVVNDREGLIVTSQWDLPHGESDG